MKKNNLSKRIMEKIITFERKRTRAWVLKLVFIISGFFVLIIALGIFIARGLAQTQALDLLTIFGEDTETIKEFWQDSVLTFWEEAPQEHLLLVLILALALAAILIFSRKKIKQVVRRIKDLDKHRKEGLS